MTYVKPGTNISQKGPAASSDSEYLMVDGVAIPFNTPVQASGTGFGFIDPTTGTFEIIDALPLGRASVRDAIERASNINFATVDKLTATEITASNGKIKGGFAFDNTPAPMVLVVTVTPSTIGEGADTGQFRVDGGAGMAGLVVNLAWTGTFDMKARAAVDEDLRSFGVTYSDGQVQAEPDTLATTITLNVAGQGLIGITPQADLVTEGTETLTLTASYPGATSGSATLTILDTSTP